MRLLLNIKSGIQDTLNFLKTTKVSTKAWQLQKYEEEEDEEEEEDSTQS